jgi:hypothetical protein
MSRLYHSMRIELRTGCNGVSGKPHRKMPERAAILKGFRMFREVSENLMIYGPREFTLHSHFGFEPMQSRTPR